MKKTIYVCGNSYNTGAYIREVVDGKKIVDSNIPHCKIVADKLDAEMVMLARPCSSNYFICKQVEYAIEQKADLVVFCLSSYKFIDITLPGHKLTQLPKLSNFDYNEDTWGPDCVNPAKNDTDQEVIQCYRSTLIDEYKKTSRPDFEILSTYMNHYSDYLINIDQERLMILGLMKQLELAGIKYIILDFLGFTDDLSTISQPKKLGDINVLNYIQVENLVKFPPDLGKSYPNPNDDFHFNQEANNMIAETILPLVKRLLEG
jgi:hypothetical protein